MNSNRRNNEIWKSKINKIISLVLSVITVISIAGCAVTNQTESIPEKNQISNIASFESCILELGEASIDSSSEDEKVVKITAVYTNNGKEPLYAACSFAVRAFQNDVEIEDCSDINGDEASLIKEIKSGESINVTYAFRLVEDSAIEVLIGEPTADQVTIGQKIYFED